MRNAFQLALGIVIAVALILALPISVSGCGKHSEHVLATHCIIMDDASFQNQPVFDCELLETRGTERSE